MYTYLPTYLFESLACCFDGWMDSSDDQCVVVQTQEFSDCLILEMDELNIALFRHDDLYRLAFKF